MPLPKCSRPKSFSGPQALKPLNPEAWALFPEPQTCLGIGCEASRVGCTGFPRHFGCRQKGSHALLAGNNAVRNLAQHSTPWDKPCLLGQTPSPCSPPETNRIWLWVYYNNTYPSSQNYLLLSCHASILHVTSPEYWRLGFRVQGLGYRV